MKKLLWLIRAKLFGDIVVFIDIDRHELMLFGLRYKNKIYITEKDYETRPVKDLSSFRSGMWLERK